MENTNTETITLTRKEIQTLIWEVENRTKKVVVDDIDFGYDLDMIRHKCAAEGTIEESNSLETFKSMRPHLTEREKTIFDYCYGNENKQSK